jgi:hypothetical protein
MSTFTWLGGSLSAPASWTQPDPMNPVEPGSSDTIILNLGGALTGSVSPQYAMISGAYTLATGTIAAGGINISAGSITQTGGSLSGAASGEIMGSLTAMVAYKQSGGTNSMAFMEFNSGTYELDAGGTLSVTSTASGEYIGDTPGRTGAFTQKGGTNTVAYFLSLGNQGTGSYDLQAGTLMSQYDYVGQNGTGNFTQEGGTNTASNRVVLGIDLTGGSQPAGTGTYTLGGTGKLTTQTIFIGSDPSCTGTFNFNTKAGDKATLSISGTGGFPGLIVGGQGIGTFTQKTGAVSTTVAVGFRTGGTGTYNFQGGSLSSTDEEVGVAGTGTFNQTAGTNTATKGDLIVGNMSGSDGTIQLHGGGVTVSVGNLTVGAQANSTGDFHFDDMTGDTATLVLTKGSITVGDGGTGTFEMGGGMLSGNLTLGSQTGGEGTFTLTGGTFTSTDGDEVIGDAGTGTFTQTAGMNLIDNGGLFLGNSANGSGTYNLGQTGMLKITGGDFQMAVGGNSTATFNFNTKMGDKATLSIDTKLIEVGVHGMATFIMGSGTLNAKLVVGGQVGSSGKFELDGGTVSAKGQVVGNDGAGTFTMNAGTDKLSSGDLILGAFAAGGGTFTMAKGTLTNGGELVGYAGAGHFIQVGGTNKISGAGSLLDVGVQAKSVGTFMLKGGTLTTVKEVVGDAGTGTVTQTGGTNTITGNLVIGNMAKGLGTYTQTGGSVAVKAPKGGNAAVMLGVSAGSNGTLSVTKAKLTTPSLVIGTKGKGNVTAGAGGVITVAKSVTIAAGSTLTSTAGSVDIGSGVKAIAKTIGIGTGGSLTGAGTVTGAIKETSKGSIKALGGVLKIVGAVSGGGTLSISDHATLDLAGKDANTVAFLGAAGILKLEQTAQVTGTITKLQVGDTIDIAGTVISKAALSGSTLTLTKKSGGTIALKVAGTLTGTKFGIVDDGHGGSDIVLQKSAALSPALALFGQYVAAGFDPHSHAAPGAAIAVTPPAALHLDLAASHA